MVEHVVLRVLQSTGAARNNSFRLKRYPPLVKDARSYERVPRRVPPPIAGPQADECRSRVGNGPPERGQ